MRRFGQVIKVNPDKLDYYKHLHANPWPGVNKMIKECNIQNFSIYYKDGFLFSYFEHIGDDYEKDMQKMNKDPETLRWWKETDPCQIPLETRKEGEWWADMEQVYHLD